MESFSGRDRKEPFDAADYIKSEDNEDNDDVKRKVQREIEDILKNGKNVNAELQKLFNKYNDVNMVVEEYEHVKKKQANKARESAQKIAHKLYKKYMQGIPYHILLKKLMNYKSEHKWSDREFDELRKILGHMIKGDRAYEIQYNQNMPAYQSQLNMILGAPSITDKGLKIKDSERGVLSRILSMYESTNSLHKTVIMHTLLYQDCSIVAMSGEYKRDKHIASNYIHPVLACMFLPKFDIFELHMLFSNIGSIVKARNESKSVFTEPDALLYYDIISDPNDVVCDVNSPITDLENRFKVQMSLWETVLKLRNGSYYETGPISELINLLNACRNNLYDEADLVYGQDEGTLMRRLMSVFSLRPTLIYARPISSLANFGANQNWTSLSIQNSMGMGLGITAMSGGDQSFYGMNPMNQMNTMNQMNPMNQMNQMNPYQYNNQPVYTVTSIPMITYNIPMHDINNPTQERRGLRSAVSQPIWINENKTLVPKELSVIHSKEVLIFYVNRRVQRIQIRTFSSPLAFSQLPLTMTGFEKINGYSIDVPEQINIRPNDEPYLLRSVVTVTESEIKQGEKSQKVITGCNGLIMTHRNISNNIYDPGYYLYDPFGASLPIYDQDREGYFTNKPITQIEPVMSFENPTVGYPDPSFADRAARTGTVFIYAKASGYDRNEIVSL